METRAGDKWMTGTRFLETDILDGDEKGPIRRMVDGVKGNYATAPNVAGVSPKQGMKYGLMAGYFGAATGIFAVFFFGEVPRVRKDILMSVPIVGGLFDKPEIPEQDNPF
ncbi:hypothetical protein FQN54_002934 [Arachnomyces sp. PD_36]|nr:hypothetical protein FQN54_002934 [Arachnomyces sp. PD_36]